jgi:hypothetical protein
MHVVRLEPGHALSALRRRGVVAGAAGFAGLALGGLLSPAQVLRSYLVAFLFWTSLALGCLALLMIHTVTGGRWGASIRRLLEAGARTLPVQAVAFLPIALGVRTLYPWARADVMAADPSLQHARFYLNVPFFLLRTAIYFGGWIAVARTFARWSFEQDDDPDPAIGRKLEYLARGALVLLGLTMTFASIDWMVSLAPHWFSTIYGMIFMGGAVLAAFGFVIPVAAVLAKDEQLAPVLDADAFHDLGKLMLAFVLLWAYFSFSQFLIIWSGNLPEEIPWYMRRFHGGWEWAALALVVFHLALPFAVLLSRELKRHAARLARVALLLLVARWVDLWWLVAPSFAAGAITFHWLDVAAMAALGGVWVSVYVGLLESHPVVPLNDPAFVEVA